VATEAVAKQGLLTGLDGPSASESSSGSSDCATRPDATVLVSMLGVRPAGTAGSQRPAYPLLLAPTVPGSAGVEGVAGVGAVG
jgi:hypothetical protein